MNKQMRMGSHTLTEAKHSKIWVLNKFSNLCQYPSDYALKKFIKEDNHYYDTGEYRYNRARFWNTIYIVFDIMFRWWGTYYEWDVPEYRR